MPKELKENQKAGYGATDYRELTTSILKEIENEKILWKIYSFVNAIFERSRNDRR